MKKQLVWLVTVSLALSLIIVSSAVALAKNYGQPENPLAQLVLQKSDLPQHIQGYYTEQLTDDRFLGSSCPANIPLQVEGYLRGYEMNAWYPFSLQDDISQGKQSGAFVLNTVYQYRDKDQADMALNLQLEWFNRQDIAVDAKANRVGYDESLAAANGVHGSAMQLTYSQEDRTWVTYWFLGVRGNTLMLLMVDGLPDPATEEVFNTLAAKVIQR